MFSWNSHLFLFNQDLKYHLQHIIFSIKVNWGAASVIPSSVIIRIFINAPSGGGAFIWSNTVYIFSYSSEPQKEMWIYLGTLSLQSILYANSTKTGPHWFTQENLFSTTCWLSILWWNYGTLDEGYLNLFYQDFECSFGQDKLLMKQLTVCPRVICFFIKCI